jgi:hypothetical protein
MFHSQRANVTALPVLRLACVLIMATALALSGCKPAKNNDAPDQQAYDLALGGSVGLSVDYQTGKISAVTTSRRVELSLTTKDGKEVLRVDCSRLGGGSITGRFHAYLGGAEIEQGEFQCLYQHAREVVLSRTADTVKIVGLRFTHIIE